jgi:hypothetical protein
MSGRDPKEDAPPKEMAVMMMTLGVDLERMGNAWGAVQLRQASRRCRDCGSLPSCRHWLADPHRPAEAYRDFCPNAGLFERYCPENRKRSIR